MKRMTCLLPGAARVPVAVAQQKAPQGAAAFRRAERPRRAATGNPRGSHFSRLLVVAVFLVSIALIPFGAGRVSAQGTVYTDDMSNPANGLLPQESGDPSQFTFQYLNGQFIIQTPSASSGGAVFATINTPPLDNSITAVDAGIGGASEAEKFLFVGCRAGAFHQGYSFLVNPSAHTARLMRQDPDDSVELAETDITGLLSPGANQFNRIEIDCNASQISGSVNGTVVLSEFDDTYARGETYLGIGNRGSVPDSLFGVFDNLTVTDRGYVFGTEAEEQGFADVMAYAETTPPTAGPATASALLANGDQQYLPAGVQVTDFYAEIGIVMPASSPSGVWNVGFCFWPEPDGSRYYAFVAFSDSAAEWVFGYPSGSGMVIPVNMGELDGVDFTPGAVNTLGLYVVGTQAILTMNSHEPAVIYDLQMSIESPSDQAIVAVEFPEAPVKGDVEATVGFIAWPEASTEVLPLETVDFSVWDLSVANTTASTLAESSGTLLFGPRSGPLVEHSDRTSQASAEVSVVDFFATATFRVPDDVSVPWDITIGFRDSPVASDEYRLTIFSTGEWQLTFGTSTPIAAGTVTNLATSPGETNTVGLLVERTTGEVALNGVEFATLDLSTSIVAGDIWLSAGTLAETTQPGRTTWYTHFEVWDTA
jgi:hypothetical protein